jgi:hypothetical protein
LPPLSSAQIIEILSSPDRTAADRTNDLRRKPEQMLGHCQINGFKGEQYQAEQTVTLL